MKLYLVQHAKAAPKATDPERALTDQGRRELQKVAAFIKPLDLSVDYLWHSGKKRAAQTAELLAEAIKINKAQAARGDLGPTDDVAALSDKLAHIKQDVMIVGHLPFLSKLTSLLLTRSESADTVAFKNSGIVCLNRSEENRWQLNWVVIPELLAVM
jgi:phosphohistidine phosphatase